MTGYDFARIASGALTVLSAMIAVAINTTTTGLSSQAVGWLVVVQAGITATVMLLPRVQGDSVKRTPDKG